MPNVEEHIRRALQEGKFENLPGTGKPLHLEDNPHADEDWRLAYHILKEAGYTLPWIETIREIETEIEQARAELLRTHTWRQAALAQGQPEVLVHAEWQRATERFTAKAAALNQRIRDYNLEAPSGRFQRPLIKPEAEISRITTDAKN